MSPKPYCDNCSFFTPVHEIMAGDEECSGVCELTGTEVSIFDYCDCHQMEKWFNEL